MESNEINVLAAPMFRDFKQIVDFLKTAGARETRSDVGECDRDDRIDFDFALLHSISFPGRDAWLMPYADAGGDGARPHAVAEIFCEEHSFLRLADTHREQF